MIAKRVVEALAVAALLLSSVLPGTAAVQGKTAAQPKTKKAVAEPTYTVLNPEAPWPEIDTKALAPRLSSFAGKTIIIYDNRGGYEKPMQGLAEQLKPLLPADTKFVYFTPTTTTVTAADLAKIPSGDAAIVGHGY